jgi:putative methyltransferase (TIGR04325 family)
VIGRIERAVHAVLGLPGIAWLRRRRFDAAFAAGRRVGVCRGVHRSYREAVAAAPATRPLGYDHEGTAAMYRDRIDHVYSSDYPMMLWLGKSFDDGARRVFDLGGHVGISYYAYAGYLDYPASLEWRVHDVPAVLAAGRTLARERDVRRSLHFADSFDEASGSDVLFTAGCVQYLETTLAEKLAALPERPRWVLVNLLPLHACESFWTVQSIGEAFCPYRVERRSDFFDAMRANGYELVDSWENPDKACIVALEPAYSVRGYAGAAFVLAPRNTNDATSPQRG